MNMIRLGIIPVWVRLIVLHERILRRRTEFRLREYLRRDRRRGFSLRHSFGLEK
ncbi:MAG: hypothetical protein PHC52_06910 [Syntrophales bacterium]|nr:hypothetical protein [Syntrophales bacterium]MDD5532505.1 hypothetical protein [Syntrophales bacterium]